MSLFSRYTRQLLSLTVLIFAVSSAVGQSNYGSVRGLVSDAVGGALAKAVVTLTSASTKISRTTTSNAAGEYVFNAVEPGNYTLSTTMSGFKLVESKGVIVDAGNTIALDLKLQVGSATETVEVSATEELVSNGTSYNGQLIDSQKLQNLPNPGRNPFLFSKLDNSVTAVGDPRFVRFQDQSGSSTISIAGAPMSSNNYLIDGVPITDFSNRAVIIPSIEGVEEVKVQANTYDAEIGRTSGGSFNTTLKSGSSALHGVLQGETRQTNWGANTFFNNRSSCTVNGVAYTQCPRGAAEFYSYVGSLSGPIPLPKFLGGKDKTFFAITEEGYRQRSPYVNSTQFVVPTALERGGDFSEIGTVTSVGVPGITPGVCVGGGTCIANLSLTQIVNKITIPIYYPGNKITNINPIGQAIINYYPAPNTTITALGKANFNGYDTLGDRADEFNGKITHQFGERWLADFYYLHYGSKEPGGNPLTNLPGSSGSYLLYRKVDAVGIQNTITINPTTVLTVGFGFNRFPNDTQDISKGFNQASLGFPTNYVAAQSKTGFPRIVASDSSLVNEGTSNSGPVVFFSRNFVVGVAKSLGKHSLKVGYNYRQISETFTSLSDTDGSFTFNALSGASAADILEGYPQTGALIVPSKLAYTTGYQAVYFQDDWRATQRLTLDLGMRYEFEPGIHERNNQIAVGFNRTLSYNAQNSGVNAVGGVEFAGQGYGTNTGNMGSKWNPRGGFAFAVDKDTVVKGGYGVFYAPLYYTNNNGYAPGYVLTNSIAAQSVGSTSVTLSNPYPNLKTQPVGNTLGPGTNIGTTLSLIDQGRRSPIYQSYSLELERQMPLGIALKFGYVGGHGRNLPDSLNINQLSDSQYAQGAAALGTASPFAFSGVGQWKVGTQPLYQSLLPFPQYQGVTLATSLGRSDYNALNVKVQKRFSKGISLLATYTWSSNWDNIWGAYGSSNSLNSGNNGPQDIYNLSPEYARATNDIPNRATFSGTYELPVGRGKHFLGGANHLVDLAVGGWKFNDITVIQNGGPLAITQTSGLSSYGNSTQRPTLLPGVNPCFSGRPEDRVAQYFNPLAFAATAPPSASNPLPYGNSPRAVSCEGPGYINSDLSLNKDFHVTEKVHIEFRAEALNAFNTPQFATPALSIGAYNGPSTNQVTSAANTKYNAGAGQITGTLGFPRLVQLGGRLTF